MKISILGKGCPNCRRLEENTRQALSLVGKEATIEKITDMDTILEYGVMRTPALVINEKVVSSGTVLSVEQIVSLLKNE
ncbi:MAG: thioredoxin family protein [Brevinematales bacterium]|nr:thioredoxin family protein [Brevinematales bacterium]